jgi:hypothetical protein
LDTKKAVVVIIAPAIFSTIGMIAAHLAGDKAFVVFMTCVGALFGLGLAFVAWTFSTKT